MTASNNLKTISLQWQENFRYKVNDTVVHNSIEYQNLTGINSEPSFSSSDWFTEETEVINSEPEKVTVSNVDYFYKNNSENGTFESPNQYDIGEYGIRDLNGVKVLTSIMFNSGDFTDINNWIIIKEVETPF